jgi:hypothetical protein
VPNPRLFMIILWPNRTTRRSGPEGSRQVLWAPTAVGRRSIRRASSRARRRHLFRFRRSSGSRRPITSAPVAAISASVKGRFTLHVDRHSRGFA